MMNELFEYLKRIHELLEQILTITNNQMTILIGGLGEDEQDEENALDMIAQMANYKDELTNELVAAENDFQLCYDACRQSVEESTEVLELKRLVAAVLERKQAIIEQEQSNLLILQAHSKKKLGKVHLPQKPSEVADAYRKQQKRT